MGLSLVALSCASAIDYGIQEDSSELGNSSGGASLIYPAKGKGCHYIGYWKCSVQEVLFDSFGGCGILLRVAFTKTHHRNWGVLGCTACINPRFVHPRWFSRLEPGGLLVLTS